MKPILFNTEMIRAILEGRKTVTRRVVKPQPKGEVYQMPQGSAWPNYWGQTGCDAVFAPKYHPGDILYVREMWAKIDGEYVFRADDEIPEGWHLTAWRPSIHMPREAARIFLRVTDMRVERLHDMPDEDFWRDFGFCLEAVRAVGRDALARPFWDKTIKHADSARYGWDANPWVWVIEFERISREEAMCNA